MSKNLKKIITLVAFAGLLAGATTGVEAQAKTSRDRQDAPSKSDRDRQTDGSANNFTRVQAERFDQNKKTEDRNEPSKPGKTKSRR